MTYNDFDDLFEARVEKLRETSDTKGVKYTAGSNDRLANFKNCVSGLTPLQVWEVFFRKHWNAIKYYLKTKQKCHTCSRHVQTSSNMFIHVQDNL